MARRAAAQRQRQARSRGDARGADAMKPIGPIPPQFAGQQGDLMIGGRRAADWVAEAGDTPLFVYDMAAVSAWISRLRAAMPAGLDVHYAGKATPFRPFLAGIGIGTATGRGRGCRNV